MNPGGVRTVVRTSRFCALLLPLLLLAGGTGNDLVLTALPPVPGLEPIALAALAMMIAVAALLAMRG